MLRSLLLSYCAACGRIGFDDTSRSNSADAAVDSSAVTCWPAWLAGAPQLAAPMMLDFQLGTQRLANPSLLSPTELAFETNANAGDVLVTTRVAIDQPWHVPATPIAELDTATAEEGRLSTSSDELVAVFSQGNPAQLVQATRTDPSAAFAMQTAAPLATTEGATPAFDPELARDGQRLYYSRGGQIFVADRATVADAFGAPAVLALAATVPADPTLSPDERVIVFSDTVPPATMRDLYFAVRADAGDAFGPPQLVPGLSTASDEGDGELSSDGCELYYSSNQSGRELWVTHVLP